MGIVSDGLKSRQTILNNRLRELAYERLQLTRRVKEIDDELAMLQGASLSNTMTEKDIQTEATVEEAKTASA